MALLIGNQTFANPTPGAASYTLSHNQNAGTGKLLLVTVTMSDAVDFLNASYNGVAMAIASQALYSGQSQRQIIYTLTSPASGTNNLDVSFTGVQYNPISISVISFTGSLGVGTSAATSFVTTPNTQTLTITAGSMIYASGVSVSTQVSGYDFDGNAYANLFSHNTNRQVSAALSTVIPTSGSKTVTTRASSGTISNHRVEILAAPDVLSGNFFLLF